MTIKELEKIRTKIKENTDDYEMAHDEEDKLMALGLQMILNDEGDPKEIAKIALSTQNLDFPRHCA